MRKHLSRVMAALLVLAMALTMLPAVSAAKERFTATPIDGIPESGQSFVIYSAPAGGVFSPEASGGAVGVSAAFGSEESANLTVQTGAGAYQAVKNADGTYYLTCGGQYLTVDSAEKLTFENEPKSGSSMSSKWKIADAGKDYDGFSIASAEVKYNNYEIFLEFYTSFKAWTYNPNKNDWSIYVFRFFSVDGTADPDNDGYIGTRPEAGELPKDGQTVVIYNDNAGAVMGPQTDDTTAPSLTGVEATPKGSGIEVGNGGLIFTVHTDGTYYTFENQGKFLRTSENQSDGSNAECLYFDTVESDYTKWTLEKTSEGYIIYNKTAKYKNNKVCIEYFSNGFSGWTYNGSLELFAMKFYPVQDELNIGYVLNPKVAFKAADAYQGLDYTFSVTLDDLSDITEMTVQYQTTGAAVTLTAASVEGKVYTYTVPMAALSGRTSLKLTASAKNSFGMTYSGETTVQVLDEPVLTNVMPAANEATGANKRPEIGAVAANLGEGPTFSMKLNGESVTPVLKDGRLTYTPAKDLADGKYVVELSVTRKDGKKAEKIWSFFVGESGLSLYFGQMHSHTAEYSDGAGTLEDAYEHAMQAKDVDFLIVTDHSNYFDTKSSATKTSYYDLSSLEKTADGTMTKWEEAKKTAEKYNALSTDFIAAYGYEMTWSGGPGHTNTFNTYGIVSRNNGELNEKSNSYAGMHLYNDLMVNANKGLDVNGEAVAAGVKTKWLENAPVVSQFNHPGTTFGTFDDFAGYTPSRDVVLNLVEVGNGEGAVGGSSYWPSYSEYDKALSKGWHVAPTNNQDNHKGKWGDSNTCRDVIVTDDFTEAGLYAAMAERRVYATEDQNLAIYYYLNDTLMGGIISLEDGQTLETVRVKASIADPDGEELGKVEVIGANGITVKTFEISGSTYELDAELPNTEPYYYLKVTQADGNKAVTAPVWVGEATPITADLKNSTALSTVGTSETITSTITNAATANYQISKVELTVTAGGTTTTVETQTPAKTLAPDQKETFTFTFKPTAAGAQTLRVLYTGTYEGEEFQCAATLELKVYDAADLINVGVDHGHDNYYLSGDYAGSAGNFISFCADNGVKCSYIEAGQFTYDNLKNYTLLVLTVPYRRNTAKATMYTEAEIAALKQYTDNGGKVILCSKSDRDNKYDNCAENSNALLTAIGAHSRIVNGIIVDNDLKANEAYRLYLSSKENFNTGHPFTAGAYTSSNAFGTTPATDNQTGFQLYNGGPVEVLDESKVQVLVRGYQSTWGTHYDGYFDGSSFVPEYDESVDGRVTVKKGDVNVMTYEDLPGGGWVITSGVTFFSNYDIKSDQDYANRFILRNILNSLKPAETVTKIADVHKAAEKEEFTVEGTVTANASGYDKNTAFFDCIYVQDDTRGINVFPVAGNYAEGMKVRVHGGVTYYCGEIELNLSSDYNGSIEIISDDITPLEPQLVTAKAAMADENIGNLMRVEGKITEIHKTAGVVDKIYVQDETGIALLFINGYITSTDTSLDKLTVGMTVSGIGIGSRDVDEESADSAIFARLRVRDRADIHEISAPHTHTWGPWETTEPAGCFHEGTQTRSCSGCGTTETRTIPANSDNCPSKAFTDRPDRGWYHESVDYVLETGLMNGMGKGKFEPDTTLNRAMVATVLYRLSSDKVSATNAFPDVPANEWYGEAFAWAQQKGIVTGFEDGTFRPMDEISRQDMALMLQRYAKTVKGTDTTPTGDLSRWPDAGLVGSWAVDALRWCVGAGIINGKDGGLQPTGNATRAEFATILMRYAKL